MQRSQGAPQGHQPDQHPEIADAVDDERLVRGVRGAFALVVEADEEPRADTDQFPENEHHRQVARNHDAEHREAEQRQRLKKPVEPPRAVEMAAVGEVDLVVGDVVQFIVHVARRVDMDAGGNERDHHEHQHRQRVDVPADREPETPAFVERVPVAGIVHRRAGMASFPVPRVVPRLMTGGRAVRRGGVLARAVRWVGRGMGATVIFMRHSADRVLRHPRDEREQRQHERSDDRRGGNTSSPLAMTPEPGTGKEDHGKGRQRQQPSEPEKRRQEGFEVHGSTGAELTPSGRRPGRRRRWRGCCKN